MPIRRSANRTLVNFLSALNNQMLEDFQVLAIPTKTNFRGINLREVVIFHGPFGYSEFSPFVEYSKNESKNWMRAAIEAAYKPKPELRKSKVKINATLPKVDLDKVKKMVLENETIDTEERYQFQWDRETKQIKTKNLFIIK